MVEYEKVRQEGETAVSQDFIGIANVNVSEWNLEKSLSDHKGCYRENQGIFEKYFGVGQAPDFSCRTRMPLM